MNFIFVFCIYISSLVSKRLTKLTETTRTCLFDIVTQYRAVFSDDEFRQTSSTSTSADFSSHLAFGKILSAWLLMKVEEYLNLLDSTIKNNEDAIFSSLDSVLNQAMYFGLSFSRIGCDFRTQLIPIFESVALRRFGSSLNTAVTSFERCSDVPGLLTMDKTSYESNASSASADQVIPPSTLLPFPILAKFANDLSTAFNVLRVFCPLSIENEVYNNVREALVECLSVLRQCQHYSDWQSFLDAFINQVIPYAEELMTCVFDCQRKFDIGTDEK